MNVDNARRRLWEVDLLRPLSILLVVLQHAFTIYWGKWSAPEGFVDCAPYKWIAATSFSFTMELFVLLSGYVFGYQMIVLKKDYSMLSLAKNKFNRLICPALIFGVIYALIFYWQRTPFDAIYSVLKGAGHLWFLPMLFWCFLLCYLLFRSKMSERAKFAILFASILLSTVALPFRLDRALYYIFFFYLGMSLIKNQDLRMKLSKNNIFLLTAVLVYLVFFISYELAIPVLKSAASSRLLQLLFSPLKKYWMFAYALPGTLFFFLLTCRLAEGRNSLPRFVLYASSVSFGVYLFHQIIIEVLYYKTSLPVLVGPYLLPWVGFAIALAGSVILVVLVRKLNLKFLGI